MLIRIARLELLNNVLVTLNSACHFLFKVIELPFEFLSLPLLEAYLHNLLVKIMLYELHLEKDVTSFVNSILRRIQVSLVPVLSCILVLLIFEAKRVVFRILGVLGNNFTLVLVFNCVDYL